MSRSDSFNQREQHHDISMLTTSKVNERCIVHPYTLTVQLLASSTLLSRSASTFNFQNIWIDHLNSESDMHSASTSTFRAAVSILLEVTTLSHREVAHLNIYIKAEKSWPLLRYVSSFLEYFRKWAPLHIVLRLSYLSCQWYFQISHENGHLSFCEGVAVKLRCCRHTSTIRSFFLKWGVNHYQGGQFLVFCVFYASILKPDIYVLLIAVFGLFSPWKVRPVWTLSRCFWPCSLFWLSPWDAIGNRQTIF